MIGLVWCETEGHPATLHEITPACEYPFQVAPFGATPVIGHPLTPAE